MPKSSSSSTTTSTSRKLKKKTLSQKSLSTASVANSFKNEEPESESLSTNEHEHDHDDIGKDNSIISNTTEVDKLEAQVEAAENEVGNDIGYVHSSTSTKSKERTPGIIYLSSIPDSMQYTDIYRVFSEMGQVGRISLQVGGPQPRCKKRKNYKEGWIEFLDKRKAKRCVKLLNNQLVGGKKKSKWYDCIWHMKYLPKFQWSHLTERLAYEQATMQQRMRTEIAQARKEAQHFAEQLDWKQRDIKMSKKHNDWKNNKRKYEYTQRMTDDEIRKFKAGSERVKKLEKSRSNVLSSLFGKPE